MVPPGCMTSLLNEGTASVQLLVWDEEWQNAQKQLWNLSRIIIVDA